MRASSHPHLARHVLCVATALFHHVEARFAICVEPEVSRTKIERLAIRVPLADTQQLQTWIAALGSR